MVGELISRKDMFEQIYDEHAFQNYSREGFVKMMERYLEGRFICKLDGGVHTGQCPTCGCEVAETICE